ncbi:hypothetical protein H0H87_004607 [Tephrocybe sp. NHM501043]|nr:hypothetical protein H0H87_004607 [Tephrocybe sp. NHM501043]
MPTTTRRKGKAEPNKDPFANPPAKVVKVTKRSPRTNSGTKWILPAAALLGFLIFLYYDTVEHILQKLDSQPRHGTAPPGPEGKFGEHAKELSEDAFIVVDLPGKGKGMLAVRDIEQGERIITERPAFIAPSQISGSPSAFIAKLLREASPKDRDAVLNLSYVHFPEYLDPETHPDEVALAIFQTNAVAVGDGVGIFPRMARLNHGCSSAFNAVYTWRDKEGILVVHALKKILKGQEILTTYTNTKITRAERSRAFLQENYGFTCTCRVCSLCDRESRASDKRLMGISDGYAKLATWGQGSINGAQAIDTVRMIWSIEDEEVYWSERGQLAADAAWVAAAHSDASATIEWARLASRWYGYELGHDSEQAREMESVVTNPQSHHGWGSREAQSIGGPAG